MAQHPVGAPEPEQPSPSTRGRRRAPPPRAVGVAVVIALIVIGVVQNSQGVTVRFLILSGHIRLIWVIMTCLVVAGALGYGAGRRGRRRRARRPTKQS